MNILSNSKNHNRLLKADKKKLVELFYIVKLFILFKIVIIELQGDSSNGK